MTAGRSRDGRRALTSRVTPIRQAAAKRPECKRRQVIRIGKVREKNRSPEGVSAKGGTLTKGLQSPVHRFDSGRRLQLKPSKQTGWMCETAKNRGGFGGCRKEKV